MLSFIIIGRNEGWKLTKCLQSVFETIKYNSLDDAEVIYVDSKSTDDSLKRAKAFKQVKSFLITGECNAAIARNIGAQESKGDILFFIDGDMEIEKEFLSHAIIDNQLKYDCVTGHLDDYLYDINDNFLGIKKRTYKNDMPKKEEKLNTNGGILLIEKQIWDEIGGMRTKYSRSQDIDLSLRLKKNNYNIIRLPALIAKHLTIEYNNEDRMWKSIKQGYFIYPAMIFRDFLITPFIWKRLLRSNYTEILLLSTIISIIFLYSLYPIVFFLYVIVLILRSYWHAITIKSSKSIFQYIPQKMLNQFINDILFWVSFFFIYPQNVKIQYLYKE